LSISAILGFSFFLISVFLLVVISAIQKKRPRGVFRSMPAFEKMRRQVFLSVEEGKRLHISIGNANLLGENNASAFVGLSVLESLTQGCILGDRPPVVTSGDGSLSLLSRDRLYNVYKAGNALQIFDTGKGRLAGVTPFTYAAGVLPILQDEKVSANLLIGHFGPEIAFLCEKADQKGAYTFAASDSLTAQAVLLASAQEPPLIGEELFALPAYIQATPFSRACLKVEDILRWILIMTLIGGALAKLIILALGIVI